MGVKAASKRTVFLFYCAGQTKAAPVRPSTRTGLNTQLQILQDKPREWLLERLHRCARHAGYPHPFRNAARIHTQGGATLIASGAWP